MTLYTEDVDVDYDTQQGACGEIDGTPEEVLIVMHARWGVQGR